MTAIASSGFRARQNTDRNVFLIFVAMVWVGVLSGFGFDSAMHVSVHGLDYPPVVHLHAVVFVGWLLLFTVQTALIRRDAPALHRRLGVLGAGLVVAMLVLGPLTAVTVLRARYAANGTTPEFLAVQLTDMIGFGVLTGFGLALRHHAAAHKRLMLLGLLYLSNAGFARLLNVPLALPFDPSLLGEWLHAYAWPNVLIVALGLYDWRTRGRLHPAYMAGVTWLAVLEAVAAVLIHSPSWKAVSLRLIGV